MGRVCVIRGLKNKRQSKEKAGQKVRFSFVRERRLFVVELELGEAVVNRVA
jgi:hypothetical protein